MKRQIILVILLSVSVVLMARVTPPAPFGAVPSARQLKWHETEFYAFIHFTTNTFNDMEWGYGDADPKIFNPTGLDANQWAKAIKAAGMKGMLITAKHHDGFCLWPSALTDYSVKQSTWMNGKGDVVLAAQKAANKAGLKFGVYLSPWDRHDLRYGKPEYIDYYRGQLKELLTQYGPIFEVWQDGANGGDGYYGGLREQRVVDKKTYYQWEETDKFIHILQPDACIFSDGGPDCRWCGNERGTIGETNWCTINSVRYAPGIANSDGLRYGEEGAPDWVPAEVDVSIRPGWFWHENENDQVKTPEQLLEIYYTSVGRGANLILNLPPNKEGRLNAEDVKALEGLGTLLKREFGNCLNNRIVKAEASDVRGNSKSYGPKKATDGNHATYWAANDGVTSATLTYTFRQPTLVNRMMLREPIALGQRVQKFHVEARDSQGNWRQIAAETTIGNKRLLRFADVETDAIRIVIDSARACPLLADIVFYQAK